MEPKITIITPVWNGLPYIRECVDSVLSQNFQDWEMVISDNCSSDDTREYLRQLVDPRIRIFYQDNNLGIFGNLNFLFKHARAPVCQILCCDDFFSTPDSLATIFSYWTSAAPEIGFVRFNHDQVVQCRLTAFQKKILPEVISPEDSDILFYIFGGVLTGNLTNISLRTRLVNDERKFGETLPFAGDFQYWSQQGREFSFAVMNKSPLFVREHKLSASFYQNLNGELIRQNAKVVTELYNKLVQDFPQLKLALRLHATLNYDSLQRYSALRSLFKGNIKYYRSLEKTAHKANFLLPAPLRWALFILSLGGRIGRVSSARYLLSRYQKFWASKNNLPQPVV